MEASQSQGHQELWRSARMHRIDFESDVSLDGRSINILISIFLLILYLELTASVV
jgi:hypothetical protein